MSIRVVGVQNFEPLQARNYGGVPAPQRGLIVPIVSQNGVMMCCLGMTAGKTFSDESVQSPQEELMIDLSIVYFMSFSQVGRFFQARQSKPEGLRLPSSIEYQG